MNSRLVAQRTANQISAWRESENRKGLLGDSMDPYSARRSARIRENFDAPSIASLAAGQYEGSDYGGSNGLNQYFHASSLEMNPTRQAWYALIAQQQASNPPTWSRQGQQNISSATVAHVTAMPQYAGYDMADKYGKPWKIGDTPRIVGPTVRD